MRLPILLAVILCFPGFGAEDGPRFESGVQPILTARCLGCHRGAGAQAGLSVESRDSLLKGGKSGAAVIPRKASDSLLLAMVATGTMPKAGPRLTEAEVLTIRKWIEGGALRDTESLENVSAVAARTVSEREVQAILSAKCWVCHGRRQQKGGLDMRSLTSLLRGGKSGAAIVPGNPESSLIVKRIAAQEMPPPKLQEEFSVRGLTDDELAKLRAWIAAGAQPDLEDPDRSVKVKDKDTEFWSFRPPVQSAAPKVKAGDRVRNPIDAFLLADLEAKGLTFAPEASARTLVRRVYFNLTGLPPTPEQMKAALVKPYEQVVNELLESPRHGERWARYWLDAVGYSDSEGGTSADSLRPHAWRYRDYVIRALNANKPFDRFLTEQIAGDELFDYKAVKEYTPEQLDLLAATGFWRTAPDSTYSTEQNFIPERMDVIAGQLEVLGSAVMGLSVGCARCHDHKYDPIPQRDYYQLVSILTPAYDPFTWLSPNVCLGVGANCDDTRQRHILLKAGREFDEVAKANAPVEKEIGELEAERKAATDEKAKKELDAQIRKAKAKLKDRPKVRALFDLGPEPPPGRVLLRGDPTTPGALVEPGALSVLGKATAPYKAEAPGFSTQTTGRRLALARWLTQPGHPLTARVFVNRVWQQHFGAGLVATAGNFGRMGTAPVNQPLLDWMAAEFVESGWDMKALHRMIVTSAAYRQSSAADDAGMKADPENKLLSRFPVRRLDSDALRDAVLAVTGRLDGTMYGPADETVTQPDGEVVVKAGKKGYRRTVYVRHQRTKPVSLLETFDTPFLNPNCVKRGESTVSSQALHLMNGDFLRETSRYMAGRVMDSVGADEKAQVRELYRRALGREATEAETERALRAMAAMRREWRTQLDESPSAEPVAARADWLALATLAHTMMNSAEFLYVD